MKKEKTISLFIEQLRKIPIVQIACEKTGISRNSIYRWRKEDEQFRKAWDEAIAEGELLVNDMSESQLISLIKEKSWSAISFWLRHHHPKYADKLLIDAIINQDEPMSIEQETLLNYALSLVTSSRDDSSTNHDSIRTGSNQENNQGQECQEKPGPKKS